MNHFFLPYKAAAAGGTPVVFDAASTAGATAGTSSKSWTHTPVGTPTKAVVFFNYYSDPATDQPTTVTYGGAAMTLVDSTSASGDFVYELANPAAGAQTVVINLDNPVNINAFALTFTGGSSATTVRAGSTNKATGTGTAASVTVTSQTDDLVLAFIVAVDAPTLSPTGTETERAEAAVFTINKIGAYTDAGAASVPMDVTLSVSKAWRMYGMSLQS